jgi:peptidoglycan/LPS O-acetylase OafA/YrhL
VSARPERFYVPELDGLRFLAFFGVFVHHALSGDATWWASKGLPAPAASLVGASMRAGAYGVDLFFVLSAFLITELLLREFDLSSRVNAKAFLVRRALRIWPLFFFFLALSAVVDRFVLDRPGMSVIYIAAFVGFLGNWACGFWGYPASVAAPLWSVSVEEQFYLLWPFVVAALGARRLPRLAFAMITVAIASRLVLFRVARRTPQSGARRLRASTPSRPECCSRSRCERGRGRCRNSAPGELRCRPWGSRGGCSRSAPGRVRSRASCGSRSATRSSSSGRC